MKLKIKHLNHGNIRYKIIGMIISIKVEDRFYYKTVSPRLKNCLC